MILVFFTCANMDVEIKTKKSADFNLSVTQKQESDGNDSKKKFL